MEKLHTKKDAEYCLWYIKKHIFPNARLIGSFGKGAESSMKDIDIHIIDAKPINRNKQMFFDLLDAKGVEDTDWGGWFFHDTIFGNVDVFFDISEFDY
jgi:hypothetical protein